MQTIKKNKIKTPREIENKKINFKVCLSVISSNLLLISLYFVLSPTHSQKKTKGAEVPKNYKIITVKAYSHVLGNNIKIQANDERGNIILKRAILLEKLDNKAPGNFKIAVLDTAIEKLSKLNNSALFIFPYAQRVKASKVKNYEINF